MYFDCLYYKIPVFVSSLELLDDGNVVLRLSNINDVSPMTDFLHNSILYYPPLKKIAIRVLFYSPFENIFYFFKYEDKTQKFLKENLDFHLERIKILMLPFGGFVIYGCNQRKGIIIKKGECFKIISPISQENKTSILNLFDSNIKIHNIKYFRNITQQYNLRYIVSFELWENGWYTLRNNVNISEFKWIEEFLYDGTYDKLHDDRLMKYHGTGKPMKLTIRFQQGKTEYTAYFWFMEEKIQDVFDRSYGVHPETKMDFIIRIDAESQKYELSMYRYGLKEPMIIKEDVYQLLVFKNKFEHYRSENYNQPRGAWIW